MRKKYEPNVKVVDRAVMLWKRMCANPSRDNGDGSAMGGVTQALAALVAPKVTAEMLERFGVELRRTLTSRGEHGYVHYLHSDYGPCEDLAAAAKAAGVKIEFPWKTVMWLYEDYLSLAEGYGAEYVYHHLLPDGRWLVCALQGSDVEKVKAYVMGGKLELQVEPA